MALRKWNFEDYSLPYGQHFLTNVLTDLWKKEKKEFIYLDRNLKIFRQNKHDILLGEEVTRPSEFFFVTTVCENDPTLFKVKLRHEPEPEPICDLPLLKDTSLTVFHWYTKASGKQYEPHNYPLEVRRKMSMFQNPEIIPQKFFFYMAGTKIEDFWKTCDWALQVITVSQN